MCVFQKQKIGLNNELNIKSIVRIVRIYRLSLKFVQIKINFNILLFTKLTY